MISLIGFLPLLPPFFQYQLNHANHLLWRCALSRSSHDMINSSLTTPLPHLKSLYYTHMGGLAVSGSHGLREYTELLWNRNTHSGCHAGTRLYIKQSPQVLRQITDTCQSWFSDRGTLWWLLSKSDDSISCSYMQHTSYSHSLLLFPGIQRSL